MNGQSFGRLDPLQARIAEGWPMVAVFEDGRESAIADLQVFPRAGGVSFKTQDAGPLSEEALVQAANVLFRDLDACEAADARP